MNVSSPRPRPPRPLVAGLLALALFTGGCEGMALLHEAIHGPPRTPAAFVLPDRTTVVLVDDPDNVLRDPRMSRQIGATAVHNLRFHEALPTAVLVDPDDVARVEARLADDWAMTPIDDIGRRLNAEQVVYARITAAGSRSDELDDGRTPTLVLDVRVVDSETGERTWPPDAGGGRTAKGFQIVVQPDIAQRRRRLSGRDTPQQTRQQLADAAGLAVAQLFYDWQPPPPGDIEE